MPDPTPDDYGQIPPAPSVPSAESAGDVPVKMNLEDIIELTDEMEHLHELVCLTIGQDGGFTTDEAYFTVVHPILDLLEVEIRVRCRQGMSKSGMKLVIQDWIDGEIGEIRNNLRRT